MNGWKVICPDGKERHYPYINHGDAACDARAFERHAAPCESRDDTECPGGQHDVVPCVFTPPRPGGSA